MSKIQRRLQPKLLRNTRLCLLLVTVLFVSTFSVLGYWTWRFWYEIVDMEETKAAYSRDRSDVEAKIRWYCYKGEVAIDSLPEVWLSSLGRKDDLVCIEYRYRLIGSFVVLYDRKTSEVVRSVPLYL